LPVDATFPDPPDIVLSSGQSRLAIEVSRVTWQRQIQVLSEARRRRPGSLVELNPELRVDKKARRGKRGSKGERNRDYGAIKEAGERLDGPGSIGDDHLHATIHALNAAIESKKPRLSAYSVQSRNVWLFLVDDGLPGAWSEIFRRTDLWQKVESVCPQTGFRRIYLYRFSECSPIRLH
jgi:hypothetical protein